MDKGHIIMYEGFNYSLAEILFPNLYMCVCFLIARFIYLFVTEYVYVCFLVATFMYLFETVLFSILLM